MNPHAVRIVGSTIIAGLWSLLAYLVAHYVALLTLGPERLYAILGQGLYNAFIPAGGFTLVAFVAASLCVWGLPFAFASAMAWGALGAARFPKRRLRACLAAAAGFAFTASLPAVLLDGWPGTLYPLLTGDDTEYAAQYSPLSYWGIRPGMSAEDVVARIGAPLRRFAPDPASGEEILRWTRSPNDSSYRIRDVVFVQGRVVRTTSEFYVD